MTRNIRGLGDVRGQKQQIFDVNLVSFVVVLVQVVVTQPTSSDSAYAAVKQQASSSPVVSRIRREDRERVVMVGTEKVIEEGQSPRRKFWRQFASLL